MRGIKLEVLNRILVFPPLLFAVHEIDKNTATKEIKEAC